MQSRADEFLDASLRRQRFLRGTTALATALAIIAAVWLTKGKEIIDTVQVARVRWHGIRVHPKHNLPYVYIPSGSFPLVCSHNPGRCAPNELNHTVRIAKSFWIGQTEVTQKAFRDVMKVQAPDRYQRDDMPMHSVNWKDAKKFCEAADLHLPTEDEWEHAARAGSSVERYGELDQIAVHSRREGPSEVRTKLPNRWGLYDMLGNVWEWTSSDYDEKLKVLRGGSWVDDPEDVRVSLRFWLEPAYRGFNLGFRCAGELP